MKGAFFLSFDDRIFDKICTLLVARGGSCSGAEIEGQIDVQGKLFTVYGPAEPEWEFREPPFVAAPGASIPDMTRVRGFVIECRWEDLFVEMVRDIAALSEGGAWVLDGDGVVWCADNVDPGLVRL